MMNKCSGAIDVPLQSLAGTQPHPCPVTCRLYFLGVPSSPLSFCPNFLSESLVNSVLPSAAVRLSNRKPLVWSGRRAVRISVHLSARRPSTCGDGNQPRNTSPKVMLQTALRRRKRCWFTMSSTLSSPPYFQLTAGVYRAGPSALPTVPAPTVLFLGLLFSDTISRAAHEHLDSSSGNRQRNQSMVPPR